MVAARQTSTLIPLQILRAVAALAVAGAHLTASGLITPRISYGAVGVDVFFVISGFIMVHASGSLFGRSGGPRIFLGRRIARIVPIYWAMTTLQIAVMYAYGFGRLVDGDRVLQSYIFLPIANGGLPINGVGWTLNYEMFFYLVFAGTLVTGRRTAVALIAAMFAGLAILGRAVPLPLPFSFWCNPIILEFVFGALLATIYAEGYRLPHLACLILIAGGVLLYVIGGIEGYYAPAVADTPIPRPLVWGVPALLIVAGAVLPRQGRQPGRLALALAGIGDASYCIYLLHPIAIAITEQHFSYPPISAFVAGLIGAPLSPGATVAFLLIDAVVSLGAITLLSMAIYRGFERPATRWLRSLLTGGRGSGHMTPLVASLPADDPPALRPATTSADS